MISSYNVVYILFCDWCVAGPAMFSLVLTAAHTVECCTFSVPSLYILVILWLYSYLLLFAGFIDGFDIN